MHPLGGQADYGRVPPGDPALVEELHRHRHRLIPAHLDGTDEGHLQEQESCLVGGSVVHHPSVVQLNKLDLGAQWGQLVRGVDEDLAKVLARQIRDLEAADIPLWDKIQGPLHHLKFEVRVGGAVNGSPQNPTGVADFFTMRDLTDKLTLLHLAATTERYNPDDKPCQSGLDAAPPRKPHTNYIKSEGQQIKSARRAVGGTETPPKVHNPKLEGMDKAPPNGPFSSQTADGAVWGEDDSTTIQASGAPTGTSAATKEPYLV